MHRLDTDRAPTVNDTQRWDRSDDGLDPVHRIRIAIAAVRAAPDDPEARAALGALVDDRSLREPLVLVLGDEARASVRPEVAAVLFEHLADLHEELDQPLDAIAAMEAVVAHRPGIADARDRLAWMYRKAGAWAKAAATFAEVGELSTDERGRAALRAAGRLYREHHQLDRAAEIFRAIVARRPGDDQAWRELDDVLAELGRWREVAAVRGTRAGRARGVERAALLRAQARALEQAGELAAAEAVVAEAATHAPDDLSGVIDHADVLVRGGRHGEAAALLQARLADAIERAAPVEQIAALRLRIVGALDDAGDRGSASDALAELLADAPHYVPALERAAAFAATVDPGTHATALLGYAAALPEADPSIVIAAARQFRAAGDHEAAVSAFEHAIELGDRDLADELEDARASLIAERARIAALAGDVEGALRRLRAVLAARFSRDAHLALVDVLCNDDRHLEASAHLAATLARTDGPGHALAPLVHRHATVHHALGNADEAHRLLHEAHRLDRRDLAITLALGESCFARRLWREAARHLGALVDHPDLARHGKAVAAGLVHAALAETRSLRPGNAPAHLEAAVRIDPACAPAWHALAEAALERGELERAADCLEREAAATLAPSERVRLYDALGDMARDVLADPARAERCWTQIVELADAPVLDKLLALQRARGATVERARTCLRLASSRSGDDAKALHEEAIASWVAGGELAQARELVVRLLAAHPDDLDVLACAADVALASGELAQVGRWLRRLDVLEARPGGGIERAARFAALWRKRGDAERALGDDHAARAAYRKAVVAAPESDHALAARRGLVELAGDHRSATSPVALESSLFALVEAEPEAGDALALARSLRATSSADARASYELARVLGAELSADDEAFYDAHAPTALASDEAYADKLDDARRRALIDEPDEPALGDIFELLGEVAALITSDVRSALLDRDLADAQRLAITSDAAAPAMLPQIVKLLGGPTVVLHASARARTELALVLAAPPAVVLGPAAARIRATSHAEGSSDAALRFELGRIVELARWRRVFAAGVEPAELRAFVAALAAFLPTADASPAARRDAERLRSRLPLAQRRRLGDRLAALPAGALDADGYLAACRRAADRAGLLACGNLTVAVERAGGVEAAPHLIALATRRDYLAARRALRRHEHTTRFVRR